jgi:hypothetical protein
VDAGFSIYRKEDKMSKQSLRESTLGKKPQFRKELVVIGGETFEVRAPSIRKRNDILSSAGVRPGAKDADQKLNAAELAVLSVIALTYDPTTGEEVYDIADKEELLDQPTGGFVDILSAACMRLLNVKDEGEEAPGKN